MQFMTDEHTSHERGQVNARHDEIASAINKLKSLHNTGDGIVEIVSCGSVAVPALRAVLFEREPSGLHETRCRAIDALSALRAHDVLIEYLSESHAAADPIERLGDDTVIGYAAWAVARTRQERVFFLLLRLAQRPALNGVIGALGTFGRPEAIPALILALEEDVSRNIAQFMLRRMGGAAQNALVSSALESLPSADCESESSLRRRRTCLSLLIEIGLTLDALPELKNLMWDKDEKVAILACKLQLEHMPAGERGDALDRLSSLLPLVGWMLREEIEASLASARLTYGSRARPTGDPR
jgi:HEAT repeat protein